jgi:hypothetical protein
VEGRAIPAAAARVAAALRGRVDIASLAAFRVLFGLMMFGGIVRFMLQGWVRTQYVTPALTFRYWGFSWVPRWPEWGMYLHFGALAVLALFIAAGLFYRASTVLFLVGFAWVQLLDVTNYLNHYYLVVLLSLLMAFLPLHGAWSVDAWRRPELRRQTLPAWTLQLVRFQVGVVYFFAGKAKLTADWLLHAQPLGIWMAARTETPVIGPFLDEAWVAYALSWAGFLFDTFIVAFLLARRTRPFAYAVVVVFHFFTHVFFDIGMFPFIMVIGALVFFPPEWPRRLLRLGPAAAEATAARRLAGWRRYALAAAAGGYCLVQLLVPLRQHLYPDAVAWAEQGMRFAWKVMVREKNGSVTFHVKDPRSGRTWQVSPHDYLEWRQVNEMSGQPDLILQLAHHVARDFEARGLPGVEVRAEAWVSLNGRRPALLLDPEVDLARVEDGLAVARWVRPGPTDAPLAAGTGRRKLLATAPDERERP